MNHAALAALAAWVLMLPVLFRYLAARRAVLAALVSGWLFLPQVSYRIEGIPDVTKTTVTCLGLAGAVALFDRRSASVLRLRWFDVPMLVWCVCPFATSIANGLGVYDGLSAAFDQSVLWGIPYAIGRIYCGDRAGLDDVAAAVVIGGLVYVPFCIFEMLTRPDLHALLYGSYPAPLRAAARYGGWRPTVFLRHGLMVGFWMAAATLTAAWLWRARARAPFDRTAMAACVAALLATTLALKSVNAWFHVLAGLGLLWSISRGRGALPLLFLLVLPSAYVALRVGDVWDARGLHRVAGWTVGKFAAHRVRYRVRNDNLVLEKSRTRPILGWGRWARSHTFFSRTTGRMTAVDSMWVEAFGECGLVGLVSLLLVHVLPGALYWRRFPLQQWTDPAAAAGAALAVVVALFAIDHCMNAMINPVFPLAAGGLTGLGASGRAPSPPGEAGLRSSAVS